MSCNGPEKMCRGTAHAAGVPQSDAEWSAGRQAGEHCPKCGGWLTEAGGCNKCNGVGLNEFGMPLSRHEQLIQEATVGTPSVVATNNTGNAMFAAARQQAGTTGEPLAVADLWRTEFSSTGETYTLQNGDVLELGKRYSGNDHPEYVVPYGKKRNMTTVGNTLLPAADQLVSVSKSNGSPVVTVELSDGGKAYYNPDTKQVVCDQGCTGMCRHQMAAVLSGEAGKYGPSSGTTPEEQIGVQLNAKWMGNPSRRSTTAGVMQAADAGYAYLSTVMAKTEFITGDRSLLPKEKPAPKSKPMPVVAPPPPVIADPGQSNGHKEVNALMARAGAKLPVSPAANSSYPVPLSDSRYELDAATEKTMTSIMRRTAMGWQAASRRVAAQGLDTSNPANYGSEMEDRVWGLYGPPGTGKNAMAREVAASLGLGYYEKDLRDRSDFQSLLVDTVITNDGQGNTKTEVKLGPVGQALVDGNVVCLNEIVSTDPDAQTALHQVIQDGIIRPDGPEGATQYWKVHPNSMLFITWNPNVEARMSKPGSALLSRTPSYKMDYPEPADEARRLAKTMTDYTGTQYTENDMRRPVNLMRQLRELYERGDLERPPSFRELKSFTKEWLLNGNKPVEAAALLRVLCSQGPDEEAQWNQVKNFASGFTGGNW